MPLTENNSMDYWGNKHPKCPNCDENIVIDDHELYDLYSEDDHEINCPFCDKKIKVSSNVSYTFSTDEQEGMS